MIAFLPGTNENTGYKKIGDRMFLKKNDVGRNIAREFIEHLRENRVIALAFDERWPRDGEHLPEQVACVITKWRNDEELENSVAIRNLTTFD